MNEKDDELMKSADANRIFEHIEQYETTTAVRLYVLSGCWTYEFQDLVLLDRNGEHRQITMTWSAISKMIMVRMYCDIESSDPYRCCVSLFLLPWYRCMCI